MNTKIIIFIFFFLLNFDIIYGKDTLMIIKPMTIKLNNDYVKKNCKKNDYFLGSIANKLNNLKGNIKVLTQQEYEMNDEKNEFELTSGSTNFKYVFNQNHEVIKDGNISFNCYTIYKSYIDFKPLISEMFNSITNTRTVETYEYDNQTGFLKKLSKIENDKIIHILEFSYQKVNDDTIIYKGVDINETYYKGKIIEHRSNDILIQYKYNDTFYTVSQYKNNVLFSHEKFNNSELLIEGKWYIHGKLFRKEIRIYDSKDNLIEIHSSSEENLPLEPEKFIYNNNNLLIKRVCFSKDFGEYSCGEFDYDSNGNITFESGSAFIHKYIYDAFGNWTEKLTYKKEKIFSKTTREIEYFD